MNMSIGKTVVRKAGKNVEQGQDCRQWMTFGQRSAEMNGEGLSVLMSSMSKGQRGA